MTTTEPVDEREHTQITPLPPHADSDMWLWLHREWWENKATAEGLVLAAYAHSVLDLATMKQEQLAELSGQVAGDVSEYTWHWVHVLVQRPDVPAPDALCGYCGPHQPHAPGECPEPAHPWHGGDTVDSCPCVGDADTLKPPSTR